MTLSPAQREFIKDASHELRGPIMVCRGHLELLGNDPEERRETLTLVMNELERMGRIVKGLELLAEAEQPDFLRPERIDLELFTHELSANANALASRRWILEDIAEGNLIADRQRLTEAVMNLALNAVQHTRSDDTIAIGASVTEDEARLWVRDTGSGISISDQAHIFDPFTRGTDAQQRYRGGGLGLTIVKAIADAHRGQVELESRVGEGSTFTIVLPRHPSEGSD